MLGIQRRPGIQVLAQDLMSRLMLVYGAQEGPFFLHVPGIAKPDYGRRGCFARGTLMCKL